MKLIDLQGKRYGRLVVLSRYVDSSSKETKWLCKCDCGNTTVVLGQNLKRQHTRSCGCKYAEERGSCNKRHGGYGTPEYAVWNSMIQRCTNPKSTKYKSYGAAGISVCELWAKSFKSFIEDMGSRPSSGHSIDRIDNSKGYHPGNCRWATTAQQADNRSVTLFYTYRGETMPLRRWCDRLSVSYMKMWKLLRRDGLPFDEALNICKS